MTMWRDGMGRLTVKYPTGAAVRHEFILRDGQVIGLCRAPGWMVTQGPWTVGIVADSGGHTRAWQMARARLKRRPGFERNLKYHLPHTEVA